MGIGFWLSEKMDYDKTTGQLLTDGTWEYKPPASQVIIGNFYLSLQCSESVTIFCHLCNRHEISRHRLFVSCVKLTYSICVLPF